MIFHLALSDSGKRSGQTPAAYIFWGFPLVPPSTPTEDIHFAICQSLWVLHLCQTVRDVNVKDMSL